MSAISAGERFQYALYVGLNLQDILYGVELVLYCRTMYNLLNHPGRRTKSDVFYAVFSSIILFHATLWVITQSVTGGKMWLSNESFPQGSDAVWRKSISDWYMDMATLSLTIFQILTDALMIYRCWMVWNSYRVIAIPLMLWTATLVLGILISWVTTASAGGVYFDVIASRLGLAFYTTSMITTIMLTGMICYRVLSHARLMQEHLAYEFGSPYFAIAELVVESVLPYTLAGIAFVASLALESRLEGAFGYLYALTMCVSPQMLILRVATRTAWTQDTCTKQPRSTVMFSPRSQEGATFGSVKLSTLGSPEPNVDLEKQCV